jgi:Mechanosensitive ion channel
MLPGRDEEAVDNERADSPRAPPALRGARPRVPLLGRRRSPRRRCPGPIGQNLAKMPLVLTLVDHWCGGRPRLGLDVDLVHFLGQDTSFALAARGVLTTVVILPVADLFWCAAKAAIDNNLAQTAELGPPNSEGSTAADGLHTLLPIFRNVLFVVVVAVAAMMALAELGVEIGPMIAGASVVGVAIGYRAQTFVRDDIAGMFHLLDNVPSCGFRLSTIFGACRLNHQRREICGCKIINQKRRELRTLTVKVHRGDL